jgi:micrococcal nuclease
MNKPETVYDYRATVIGWIDGDTLDVSIDHGFRVYTKQRVRLYGIDTAELTSGDPALRAKALAAKQKANELAPAGTDVQLKTVKEEDKYGRYLAVLTTSGGADLARLLIEQGLGSAYFGGKR